MMIKSLTTLFTIFSLVLVTAAPLAVAQTRQPPTDDKVASKAEPKRKPDLKKSIDDETKRFEQASAQFDAAKYDWQQQNQTAKKGWSTKDKVLLGAFIVGVTVLVVLLIKYGKECIRSNPANCTPGVDEFCTCEEYEQSNR